MRRVVAGGAPALVAVVCLALVPGLFSGSAFGDPCEVDATGICLEDTVPGTPPVGDSPTPPTTPTGDGGCRDQAGDPVPCTDGYGGSWSGGPRWCYQYRLDPQPPAASPLWGAHDPSEGSLWSCDYGLAVPGNSWFVPDGAAIVDAASLAQDLLSRADFAYAAAASAPGGDDPTYVGYLTWLWIPPDQWEDVSASITVSGATVTIRGVPTEVEWTVGSQEHVCRGPGRVWQPGLSENAKTTCAIAIDTLRDPNGERLGVSARIRYAVTWSCTGRCSDAAGDLGSVAALPGPSAELVVRQRQTVVTG